MLSCRQIAHQADAFLDGELSFWQKLQVRLHLSMCKACARFMGQMRVMRALIAAEPAAIPNEPGRDADKRITDILSALHEGKKTDD